MKIRPYSTLYSRSFPSAPRRVVKGGIKINPGTIIPTPRRKDTRTSRENRRFAPSGFFSPSVFAISALPPTPNIYPMVPRMFSAGIIILMAANSVLPTNLATKNPSTTIYRDRDTFITMEGSVKRSSLR